MEAPYSGDGILRSGVMGYRNSINDVREKGNMNILCKSFTNEMFRAIISSIKNYMAWFTKNNKFINHMEIDIMSFKIVVDSCCELPEEYLQDPRFEIVPLGLEVGDYRIQDDENFDQAEFLKKVAGISQMSQVCLPFPGEVPGGLSYRGRARICDHLVITPKWKLQQCGAGNESVSGKIR